MHTALKESVIQDRESLVEQNNLFPFPKLFPKLSLASVTSVSFSITEIWPGFSSASIFRFLYRIRKIRFGFSPQFLSYCFLVFAFLSYTPIDL
jgi:hypothetical protein